MGRPKGSRELGIWMNGTRVATWRLAANGSTELTYDSQWIRSRESRPLSLSLPINFDGAALKGDAVEFYFDNLLPDSDDIRQRAQSRFHTRTRGAFDLLEAVGRDCVGAIQLLPDAQKPVDVFAIDVEPLSEEQIEQRLLDSLSPVGGATSDSDDDFRISIAGAQEKTAFTLHGGEWCRPKGSTPTTHIFKLPLGLVGNRRVDIRESLENEWLCARLMEKYGVDVARSELLQFGSTKVLAVERFDRKLHASGQYWLRLPQEDLCQATGTPASRKYESDGGPGLEEIAKVLQGSERRSEDIATLLKAQLLFWMLGATDGHAKNFSIRLLAENRYQLTPLYDVLSVWPVAGTAHNQWHPRKLKLAMSVRGKNKHYRLHEIQRKCFNVMARRCGLGADMESIIAEVIERTPQVIESVGKDLPKGFPVRLFDVIACELQKAANTLETMSPTAD